MGTVTLAAQSGEGSLLGLRPLSSRSLRVGAPVWPHAEFHGFSASECVARSRRAMVRAACGDRRGTAPLLGDARLSLDAAFASGGETARRPRQRDGAPRSGAADCLGGARPDRRGGKRKRESPRAACASSSPSAAAAASGARQDGGASTGALDATGEAGRRWVVGDFNLRLKVEFARDFTRMP